MPRQTFATREFFVNSAENATHRTVLDLPYFFSKMKFLGENSKLHCITFLYAPDSEHNPIHVVISLLPLDDGCTKITVHGSYPNGCVFSKDGYMENAVDNVEAALQAATSGAPAPFEPIVLKKKFSQRYRKVKHNTAAILGNALKSRRFFKPSHS